MFSNIKEQISYHKFCSFCKNDNRELIVEMGPDDPGTGPLDYLKLSNFTYQNDILSLNLGAKLNDVLLEFIYNVDCVNNTFKVSKPKIKFYFTDEEKISYPSDLYLYMQSRCAACKSYATGLYIKFDFFSGTLSDFDHLDYEEFHLNDFLIDCQDSTAQVYYRTTFIGKSKRLQKIATLPIDNLCWEDKDKLLEQLETFKLFA